MSKRNEVTALEEQNAQRNEAALRDVRLATYCFSGAVVAGFLVYWVVQIQSVREMLALAYG